GQPHPHLHPHRRCRDHPPGRHERDVEDRPEARGVRRRRRGERLAGGGAGLRRPRGRRRRAGRAGAERPVRRGRRPVHAGGRGAAVPAAARGAGLRRPPRGLVRHLQRAAAGAALVHPQRRHGGGGAPARRPDRRTPRGALGLGGVARARGHHERPHPDLPQPALRPAVHPRPAREPGAGRRAVEAGRRAGL
ncbi:MAG: ATP:Cob(I)alamin adenosyltransferase, partial [uncultured Nocardioides sp.]